VPRALKIQNRASPASSSHSSMKPFIHSWDSNKSYKNISLKALLLQETELVQPQETELVQPDQNLALFQRRYFKQIKTFSRMQQF